MRVPTPNVGLGIMSQTLRIGECCSLPKRHRQYRHRVPRQRMGKVRAVEPIGSKTVAPSRSSTCSGRIDDGSAEWGLSRDLVRREVGGAGAVDLEFHLLAGREFLWRCDHRRGPAGWAAGCDEQTGLFGVGDSRRTIGRMANKAIFRAPMNPMNTSLSSPTIPATQPVTQRKIASLSWYRLSSIRIVNPVPTRVGCHRHYG